MKDKPSLTKSQSEDRLDSDNIQSRENISTERSALSTFSDGNTTSSRSKFTSREAVVKSQRPATKPLHLGKCQLFPFRGFPPPPSPPLVGLKFEVRTALYKNLFSLKFETGSCFLKSIKKFCSLGQRR